MQTLGSNEKMRTWQTPQKGDTPKCSKAWKGNSEQAHGHDQQHERRARDVMDRIEECRAGNRFIRIVPKNKNAGPGRLRQGYFRCLFSSSETPSRRTRVVANATSTQSGGKHHDESDYRAAAMPRQAEPKHRPISTLSTEGPHFHNK
jgi:hypothetical protein